MSLVEVSPSMEMQLNDLFVAVVRREERAAGVMGASVQRMARRVAMLGWIMPAPFVMPAREKRVFLWEGPGRVKVVERSLGKVSVVQMARAAADQAV